MADDKDRAKTTTPYPGMLGDGTEEQSLDQPGNPNARIAQNEVEEAFGKDDAKPQDGPATK